MITEPPNYPYPSEKYIVLKENPVNSIQSNFAHEALHFYASDSFKQMATNLKKSYSGVWDWSLDEGVTEYFTRQLYPENSAYETETSWVRGIVSKLVGKMVGEKILRDAYFKGDKNALIAVEKAAKKYPDYLLHSLD